MSTRLLSILLIGAMTSVYGQSAVAPGDDFFAYANGDWLAATQIPPGKARWGARNEIAERAARQREDVIRNPGPSVAGLKVADFRSAFADEAGIEKRGLAPVAPLLREIEALRDRKALSRFLGAHLRADVDPLGVGVYDSGHVFGLAVANGIHGQPGNFAYLVQGGLGLGNRDAYLDGASAKRLQYRDYIERLLAAAGFDRARKRADAVLALETDLARTHATAAQSGNERNADNRWARADFARKAPGIDWGAFFAAAQLAKTSDIVVWQPDAITGTAKLVASQPLAAWKEYLRFHVLHRYAEVLPRAFAEAARAQKGLELVSRDERALAATQDALPEAVGRVYVERYFPPETKARVQAILHNVAAAFRQRVAAASWMSADTKRVALTKLHAVYFGVGYPEAWPDDSPLDIDAHDPVGNLRRIAEWRYRMVLAKLGRPVDPREWAIHPQVPGGLLNFQTNAYNFTAALLQPPRFDPAASDAANYGSIGAVFGHELSHYVDTLGADYDEKGDARGWWTAEDKAAYAAATQPLVEQFSAYRPLPDAAVDGKLTLVENLADLGGVAAAFDAYRAALGSRATRDTDREFFIGFARSWRSKLSDEALRAQVKSDGHAPDPHHVATVRNLDAWYEAFDVRPGQALYLAPERRVRVW